VKNTALVLMLLSAFATAASAGPTADKKKREAVDKSLAVGIAEIKDCGKTFKITFDWNAFDKIDWSKAERTKDDQTGSEITNVRWVGHDINKLCQDKDYKEPLLKIDNVVYRTTVDKGEKSGESRLKAKIEGKTLTFENRMGGSSRDGGDFAAAAKKVL
jgi:hypothetical protein